MSQKDLAAQGCIQKRNAGKGFGDLATTISPVPSLRLEKTKLDPKYSSLKMMPVAKKGHFNVIENHIPFNANRNWFFLGKLGLPCGAQPMIPSLHVRTLKRMGGINHCFAPHLLCSFWFFVAAWWEAFRKS